MSAAFTPGPWRTGRQRKVYAVDTPLAVAQAVAKERDYSEADANARLIAAAPDMFDVIEHLVNGTADIDTIYEDARAALAKARGEP